MTPRARLAGLTVVVLAVGWGCASSVTLTSPPVAKRAPEFPASPRARLGDFTGAPCLREEVARYLSSPGGLQLAADGAPGDVTLTGAATRLEVHSNRGDKEAALAYFTAFVITAPIAAVMHGAKDWHADAAADGELVASDATGAIIWKRSVTVSVSESQRTMPTDEALRDAMTAAVCQKLAATLLNGLTEHLASRR
jgi:hypothetical protein